MRQVRAPRHSLTGGRLKAGGYLSSYSHSFGNCPRELHLVELELPPAGLDDDDHVFKAGSEIHGKSERLPITAGIRELRRCPLSLDTRVVTAIAR